MTIRPRGDGGDDSRRINRVLRRLEKTPWDAEISTGAPIVLPPGVTIQCPHEQIDAHPRHVPGRTGQCRDCGAEMAYSAEYREWLPALGLVDHDKYESRRSRA